jgi:hypothetical protein
MALRFWSAHLGISLGLYIGDEDGSATVIDLALLEAKVRTNQEPLRLDKRDLIQEPVEGRLPSHPDASPVWVNPMHTPLLAAPSFANDTLYWSAGGYLCAIASITNAPGDVRPGARADAPDGVFVPTPQDVVERMLEFARVTEKDQVVDLGSGDGRVLITAARKHGSRAVGYELDTGLVEKSLAAVREQNVESLVRIEKRDLFDADLSTVDVVVVFLPGSLLEKLLPQFRHLKPGARIVSHDFLIPGFEPDETIRLISSGDGAEHAVHLWKVPLKVRE